MRRLFSVLALGLLGACSSSSDTSDTKTDEEFSKEVTTGIQAALKGDIEALAAAAKELQAAAPTPTGRGWDETQDAAALTAMRTAWLKARSAYERTEGAIAPLFPDTDAAIDARYEDFLEELGATGDQNLFDGEGVTGMHAVERILFVKSTPSYVVDLEKVHPGYKAAAFPSTEQEAKDFKDKLVARLVADTDELVANWTPVKVDLAGAYDGLIALVNEQQEKVNKASTQEEESRYSQRTLADLRDNLAGVKNAYAVLKPWVTARTKDGVDGKALDGSIEAGFGRLAALYAQYPGDAVPQPPATWSATPSADDLASPFGKLYTGVKKEVDAAQTDSIVAHMTAVAGLCGIKLPSEGE